MDRCASCGKSGDSLKACAACKLVKYCGVACQRAHRPVHKQECRKRAVELHEEALFAVPPGEDCPICMLRMPVNHSHRLYQLCCGKELCVGCALGAQKDGRRSNCPFCRSPPLDLKETLEKAKAMAAAGDAYAISLLGDYHDSGEMGFPLDRRRAVELWLRAGELGAPDAYCRAGAAHAIGTVVEEDMAKAEYYWGLAAMAGNQSARCNLGRVELEKGKIDRSVRHFMIAAGAGERDSLDEIRKLYLKKFVKKDVFEKALRLHKKSTDEMKSGQRDKAVAFYEQFDNEGNFIGRLEIVEQAYGRRLKKVGCPELRDEDLFAVPPGEDCPICMLRMPVDPSHRLFKLCCGKVICLGCDVASQKRARKRPSCPFCRSPLLERNANVVLEKTKAKADAGDANAIFALGTYHDRGDMGFPKDQKKAVELWLRAGKHGAPDGYCSVGLAYSGGVGVERDMEKAKYYWGLAAMGGSVNARYNLGLVGLHEERNIDRSVRHFMIAAGAGEKDSLDKIRELYARKLVKKGVFEKALRLHQQAVGEMKSDQRDEAIAAMARGLYVTHA